MSNTLVNPSDLNGFPGAPFSEQIVDSAVAELRREAGWHIAPGITETVVVDGSHTTVLLLPTLRLTAVTEVRDVSSDTPEALEQWRSIRRGALYRRCGWPCGLEVVEVDMTHGFAETPADLLPVIAEKARLGVSDERVSSETAGGESISYRTNGGLSDGSEKTFSFYKLPTRFGQ